MRGSNEVAETAVVGVHIGPEWDVPEAYRENVRSYMENAQGDFLFVGYPGYDDGGYAAQADASFESDEWGRLEASEVDQLLNQYERFDLLGAYWGACHRGTFHSLVSGIYDDVRNGTYNIVFPTDCITDTPAERFTDEEPVVSDKLASYKLNTPLGNVNVIPPWETSRELEAIEDFSKYVQTVEDKLATGTEDRYDYTVDGDDAPVISWTLHSGGAENRPNPS